MLTRRILDAKVCLDINIVGVGSYTNNDLVYLSDQSWGSLSSDLIQLSKVLIDASDLPDDEDIGYNQGRKKYRPCEAYGYKFSSIRLS